jgi:hypothetical protein
LKKKKKKKMATFQTFATPGGDKNASSIIASIDNVVQHTASSTAIFDEWAQVLAFCSK